MGCTISVGFQQLYITDLSISVGCTLYLKALQRIAGFCLFGNNFHDSLQKLSPLSIMAFRPIVPSTRMSEDEVVRFEESTLGTICKFVFTQAGFRYMR